jgi:putative glutamine amidotransferase
VPPETVLDVLDGLLLTGSGSNIEPHHYDGPPPPEENQTDPARDATTLPLIRSAIARGLPVLGICRGLQELNVALGGTLHQEVHRVEGRMDHRSDREGTPEHRFRPVHPVALTPGGYCAAMAGTQRLEVNSLHGQGIERLGRGLDVEAVAPDGQIEAVRLEGADFVMAVQWHPEWQVEYDRFARDLFGAFGAACRRHAARRGTFEHAA